MAYVPLTRDTFCVDLPGWDAGKSVYGVPDTVEQTQFRDFGLLSGISLHPRMLSWVEVCRKVRLQ